MEFYDEIQQINFKNELDFEIIFTSNLRVELLKDPTEWIHFTFFAFFQADFNGKSELSLFDFNETKVSLSSNEFSSF